MDAAVVGRGGDRVPGAQEVPAPGSGDGRLSERLREAAPADDEERDGNGTPAAGEMGLWSALRNIFPGSEEQRCWNHRVVNLLTQVPKQRQGEARELLTKIPYQTSARQAQQKKRVFQNWCLEHGYERAAELIEENWEQMVSFYRFPRAHWRHLRTSNVVESPFAALRLRTDAAKRVKKVANATAVVWKMLLLAERKFRCITHRLTEPPNGLLKEYRTPACAAKWHTTSKRCSAQSAATEAASVRSRC